MRTASNITRRTQPGGTVADYTFDPLNRLASVASGGQTTSYGYDVASNLTQTTFPSGNGYVETRAYDRAGRLTEVNAQKGATLARFVSTLDSLGTRPRSSVQIAYPDPGLYLRRE